MIKDQKLSLYGNTPNDTKKQCKSTKPESHQTAHNDFLSSFLHLLQTKLVQHWMTLSWRFLHKTAAFYAEQLQWTSPSLFKVSQGAWNQSLNNYGFICDAIFFTSNRCTKHLAMRSNHYVTRTMVGVHRDKESCWHCQSKLTQCLNRCLLQPYCMHPLRKPVVLLLWAQSMHLPLTNTKDVKRGRDSWTAKSRETR